MPVPTGLRELGRTGVRVPPLGLGCAPVGNFQRPVSEERAQRTLATALELGCTYLDTAPHYGVGLSEERLGRALAGRPPGSYVLSTKVGRRLRELEPGEEVPPGEGFVDTPRRAREWDLTRDGIWRTMEASLERLGVDRIDVLLLHDVENHVPEVYRTAFPALAELREQKLVRAVGFGMNHSDVLARFVADLDVDVVLCAGRWTLLDRTAHDDLLPVCARRSTSVVVGGVYNSGLLADPRAGATYDYRAAPPELLHRAQRLAACCAEFDVPLRAAALRFPFGHPAVASVVVGTADPEAVRDNVELFSHPVPDELWHTLVDRGLVDADLPLPV